MDEYVGIPFLENGTNRNGLDCYRLVVLIYREKLGIELQDFVGVFVGDTLASMRKVARLMRSEKQKWQKVEKPQRYDVVLFRSGAMAYHVGIVVDHKRMLHISDGIDSTIDEYTGIEWRNRVEGFYRYSG